MCWFSPIVKIAWWRSNCRITKTSQQWLYWAGPDHALDLRHIEIDHKPLLPVPRPTPSSQTGVPIIDPYPTILVTVTEGPR